MWFLSRESVEAVLKLTLTQTMTSILSIKELNFGKITNEQISEIFSYWIKIFTKSAFHKLEMRLYSLYDYEAKNKICFTRV